MVRRELPVESCGLCTYLFSVWSDHVGKSTLLESLRNRAHSTMVGDYWQSAAALYTTGLWCGDRGDVYRGGNCPTVGTLPLSSEIFESAERRLRDQVLCRIIVLNKVFNARKITFITPASRTRRIDQVAWCHLPPTARDLVAYSER